MKLLKRKEEEEDADEEIEKLLRGDEDEGSKYFQLKIKIEGLDELVRALEELTDAIKSKKD
ncbi:MAG: hypothetical protein JZD41_04650 [Thermoproteus sp.]|nr:hypothetical protein [Thermoproteus sp.]